jgi:hypothetical protein
VAEAAILEEILGREKCTKQLALNVAKNVKFHSSQLKASLFIAENAMQKRKNTDFLQKK